VVEFVRRGIAAKQELSKICENMMDNCLASNSETGGVGCDNMTMTVIGLLRGKSKEEWYEELPTEMAHVRLQSMASSLGFTLVFEHSTDSKDS
jgi:protein phosphatase 2C family protein 2/3